MATIATDCVVVFIDITAISAICFLLGFLMDEESLWIFWPFIFAFKTGTALRRRLFPKEKSR